MLYLEGHEGAIECISFLPDGRLVSGGRDATVKVWNVTNGSCLITRHALEQVSTLAIHPQTLFVAYPRGGKHDEVSNVIVLFDPTTNKTEQELAFHITDRTVIFDPNNNIIGHTVGTVSKPIANLTFSSDGRHLIATFKRPGDGYLWDLHSHSERPFTSIFRHTYQSSIFAAKGMKMVHTTYRRVLICDSPESTHYSLEYLLQNSEAADVAFAPSGDEFVVAAASYIHFIKIRQQRNSKKCMVKSGFRFVKSVAFSPDGKYVIAGGKPSGVEVYEVTSKLKIRAYDFEIGVVLALAFSPDGLTFAVAGEKGLAVCDADF